MDTKKNAQKKERPVKGTNAVPNHKTELPPSAKRRGKQKADKKTGLVFPR